MRRLLLPLLVALLLVGGGLIAYGLDRQGPTTAGPRTPGTGPSVRGPEPGGTGPGSPGAVRPGTPGVDPSGRRAPGTPSPSVREVPVPQLRPVVVPAGLRPRRIVIPQLGVDAGLEVLGINADRTIGVPRNPDAAGWLEAGPAPGAAGPAIVAGHVDSDTGPAVFWRLAELRPGAVVSVRRGDGSTVAFRVDAVEQFSRTAFPTARVYGPTPVPSLRLITCAGPYDETNGYRDNIVVFASAVT